MIDLPVMFKAWREKLNDTSTNTLVKNKVKMYLILLVLIIQNVIFWHQNYSRYSTLIHIHPVFTF